MKKILEFSKGNRVLYILAPLFKMLEATLELIVPLIVAEIIDKGIGTGDRNYIIKLCIQLVILGVTGFAFSLTAQYFAAKAAISTVKKTKQALFEKVQKLSFSQLDSLGPATLITRLTSDTDSVQNGINLTLRLLLRSPFVVAGACIMAYRVDGTSSLVFAAVLPLLCIFVFAIMLLTIPLYSKVRAALDRVLVTVRESFTGARVIRAFRKEKATEEEFISYNGALTKMQIFAGRISALMNPLTQVTVNIGVAVLIFVGAVRVDKGIITAGAVVALYNYMSQILVELVKFANLVIQLTKSFACAGRIEKILDMDTEKASSANGGGGKAYIEFRNVTFRYNEGAEPALRNVSFTVNRGEKVGIVGSTGSGKTTLINLLCGFYTPQEGRILIDGRDVSDMSGEERRSLIIPVEQKPAVFDGTVRSNLLLGKSGAGDGEIIRALRIAQAYGFVSEKPGGIDAVCGRDGMNFSGGQRQRLAIARAVLADPDILVLDDSFSALDFATESALRKELAENLSSTLFIVSQRSGSVLRCDKIIVLEDGECETGTHESLLGTSKTYREIHLSQFDGEDAV